MQGLNALSLNKYFNFGKSILQNNKFYVTFLDNAIFKIGTSSQAKKVFERCGPMPVIQHHHVLSCNLPQYDFKKEVQQYGPIVRSFPYMDFDGFELKIELEENTLGSIAYFVNWLQRRIIDRGGYYTPPEYAKFDSIIIEIEDSAGIPVAIYQYKNCYYLNSNSTDLNYGGNESIKYQMVFNADYLQVVFPKSVPVNLLHSGAVSFVAPLANAI